MATATLSGSHSRIVTLDDLRKLPDPKPIGNYHVPVRHDLLVSEIEKQVEQAGYVIRREQLAINGGMHSGDRIFGTLDLTPMSTTAKLGTVQGRAVGFRHGNDGSMALGMVAGERVFVCDNMMFSGDAVVMHRKHTKGFDLQRDVAEAMDRLVDRFIDLDALVEKMQNEALPDRTAEAVIYDAFMRSDVMALRHMPEVHDWYFGAAEENAAETITDVAPRSAWGLYNAFTRVIRGFEPHRTQEATAGVTRYFTREFNLN